MDNTFSHPNPVKSSKPPVKSWSELLNNAHPSKPASGADSNFPSRPASTIDNNNLEVYFDVLSVDDGEGDSSVAPDKEFLNRPINYLKSRPIVNPGNRCYMIAILQVLLHTKSFTNYLQKYFFKLQNVSKTVLTGKFPLILSLKSFYSQFVATTCDGFVGAVSQEPIDEIFLALKGKKGSFSSAGFAEQEDAEEFLTALLDALGDEFISLQSSKLVNFLLPFQQNFEGKMTQVTTDANANSDDWLQVGPKQRIATTRRTPVSQSPIHTLFSGNFQSLYTAPGSRPSITFEPFTILPLSLIKEKDLPVVSVTGAIEHVMRCEDLGKKSTKQLSFASLPPILIIQLKRFIYKQNSHSHVLELHKITNPIEIPLELKLNQGNIISNTYNLYALVNHHGRSLNAGHYTSIIKTDSTWSCFDDDVKIQPIGNISSVLNQNSSAYLLFYSRIDK